MTVVKNQLTVLHQFVISGQFADKPTRSWSSHGLVNLQTSQLTDSDLLKITERPLNCALNLYPTLALNSIDY